MHFCFPFSAGIGDRRPFPAAIGAEACRDQSDLLSTVLRSNTLQFANFVFWIGNGIRSVLLWCTACLMCLPQGERESTWGPKAPKQKLRKTSNYIIRDPRPLKNNILQCPFFGHVILFEHLHFTFSYFVDVIIL